MARARPLDPLGRMGSPGTWRGAVEAWWFQIVQHTESPLYPHQPSLPTSLPCPSPTNLFHPSATPSPASTVHHCPPAHLLYIKSGIGSGKRAGGGTSSQPTSSIASCFMLKWEALCCVPVVGQREMSAFRLHSLLLGLQ